MTATPCISSADLIAQPNGSYTVKFLSGVLSVQPDGTFATRPTGTAGPWESGVRTGNTLVFTDGAYPTGRYAVLVV